MPPEAREAHYYFDPGQPRVTIHLPVDPNVPIAADDLGVWVAQIMESTHALTHAYELAGNEGVHLVAGADLQWHRAPEAPAPVSPHVEEALRPRSWHAEQEAQVERDRRKLQEQLEQQAAPPPAGRKPVHRPSPAQVDRELAAIEAILWGAARELRQNEISAALPMAIPLDYQTLNNRLQRLQKQGRATARTYHDGRTRVAYWQATSVVEPPPPPGRNGAVPEAMPEAADGDEEPDAAVVAWTKGKTLLFWGGTPPGSETKAARIREIEARLQLKECRWREDKGLPRNMREIERQDVDFVVVGLFNSHQVTEQVARAAIQRGIPVFRIGRTNSVSQLLHTLQMQIAGRQLAAA